MVNRVQPKSTRPNLNLSEQEGTPRDARGIVKQALPQLPMLFQFKLEASAIQQETGPVAFACGVWMHMFVHSRLVTTKSV